jgi:aldehyde oxidoreductase
MIAPGLGVELENMVMVQNPAGGTFGYKFSPTMEALVGAACLATGKPVFLRYDYHQQMTYTGKRSPFFVNMRMAADKDGKLLAMETDWSVDHGPYSEFGDLLTLRGAQFMGAGYDIPNIRGEGPHRVHQPRLGLGLPGLRIAPERVFASEVLMDELAEKLGMDPLELRYKNVYREGSTTPTGSAGSLSLPEMIDILRPKYQAAWKRPRPIPDDRSIKRAWASPSAYTAAAWTARTPPKPGGTQPDDNTVTVYACWEDHGQGADMGTLGTAHEALRPLGMTPDQITWS